MCTIKNENLEQTFLRPLYSTVEYSVNRGLWVALHDKCFGFEIERTIEFLEAPMYGMQRAVDVENSHWTMVQIKS